jgi:hypothetical protein
MCDHASQPSTNDANVVAAEGQQAVAQEPAQINLMFVDVAAFAPYSVSYEMALTEISDESCNGRL